MNAEAWRAGLSRLLLEFRPLWQAQPFCEVRPAWCEQHPELAADLLALSDERLAYLQGDSLRALQALGERLPNVADLLPLLTLVRRELVPLVVKNTHWANGIPGRKQAQIEAFASAMQPLNHPVLEWCAGKGHLGRLLAQVTAQPVISMDVDADLCRAGERAAGQSRVQQHFVVRDALAGNADLLQGRHAIALHACGDLHRSLLLQGVAAGVPHFDIAPCCYHRGVLDMYQGLSGVDALHLTRDEVRLAVTETQTASPRLARQRDQQMAWKLAFVAWRERVTGAGRYRPFKPVPADWFRQPFGQFMSALAQREGFAWDAAADTANLEGLGWLRQREVMRLSLLRQAFRRALELWLVLDLGCYLEQQGYMIDLFEFCPPHLTPRNLMLSARRH